MHIIWDGFHEALTYFWYNDFIKGTIATCSIHFKNGVHLEHLVQPFRHSPQVATGDLNCVKCGDRKNMVGHHYNLECQK